MIDFSIESYKMNLNENQRCTRCEKKLNPNKIEWLELDQRTYTYTHDFVPEEFSQGGFPFGLACAKIELALHKQTTNQK